MLPLCHLRPARGPLVVGPLEPRLRAGSIRRRWSPEQSFLQRPENMNMSQHAASNSRRDNAVAGRGWAAGVGKDLRRGAGVRRLSARQPSTGPIPATAAANHGRHHPRDRGGYRQDHLAHNHSPACVAIPLLAFFLSSKSTRPAPSPRIDSVGDNGLWPPSMAEGTTEGQRQEKICTMPSSQVLIRPNTQTRPGTSLPRPSRTAAPTATTTALAAISAPWRRKPPHVAQQSINRQRDPGHSRRVN